MANILFYSVRKGTLSVAYTSKFFSIFPLYNIFKIQGGPLSPPLTRPLHPISIVNSIGPKSSSFACLFSVLLQYCGVLPLDKLKVICQKKPCDNVLSSIGHLSTICLERQSVYRQTLGMAPFRAKGFTVHYGRNGTNCVLKFEASFIRLLPILVHVELLG